MTLADRSISAFIGPSGCGKSTLLRVMNRMYALYPGQRAEGEVLIGGRDILGPIGGCRGTALPGRHGVSKAHAVPHVGVRQCRLRPAPGGPACAAPSSRCAWNRRCATRPSGTRSRTSCRPTAAVFPAGQQQRLCIARAIAVQPEVLLLDEPTAALDPISTLRVEETLQALREKYCIVMVTHNLQQAARVSNVTGFMFMGELVEIGPSSEIFTSPKNRKTDDYITGRFG